MKHNALINASQKLNSSESERLHSLKEYDFSEQCIDENLDTIAEMALKTTQCEVAAITFLYQDKLFFKSINGLKADYWERGSLPCEITIGKAEVYEIPDLDKHPTLQTFNYKKGSSALRYYAGVPLVNQDGFAIGTLCILDTNPKKLSAEKLHLLSLFGQQAMAILELQKKERLSREALERRSGKLIEGRMELLEQSKKLDKVKAGISSKEQLLRGILDNSPHLISLLDKRGYYVMVNQAMSEIFKLDTEAIVGRHISELIDDTERLEQKKRVMQKVLSTGKISEPYAEVISTKGITNYYQVVMIPVKDARGDTMVLRIATNVTELKSLENSLQRKNEELEGLIYSLSHDLRGPISSILGLLNVEKYASKSDMQQYFKMIKQQALKMDTSIHDLVELKNVTNRGITPDKVQLEPLLQKTVERYTGGKISIKWNKDGELDVNTDEYFVHTALNRVLANAVEYHRKDATNPEVEIAAKAATGGLTISIKDNGMGISPKALPRVFEMFYRGTSFSQGHGLGLYIAQNALNRVKAEISLKSIEGLGTEVELFIPNIEGRGYYE